MSELKPCPFCETLLDKWIPTELQFRHDIRGCILDGRVFAVEHWNTRPIEDALNKRIIEVTNLYLQTKDAFDVATEILLKQDARIAELKDVLEKVYDEWITCDDDWWTEEVDELKEKAARILKSLPEVQE